MPRTRTTRSSWSTSYITRWSPTRSRWNVSADPGIDFDRLPPIRPPSETLLARSRGAFRIRCLSSCGNLSKARAAALPRRISYGSGEVIQRHRPAACVIATSLPPQLHVLGRVREDDVFRFLHRHEDGCWTAALGDDIARASLHLVDHTRGGCLQFPQSDLSHRQSL